MADADALRRLERRIRRRLDARVALRRAAESLPAIAQIVVGVAGAYAIAHWGLGHALPLFAVTVTINSLGLTRDARPRRVLESLLGILLGIALADAFALVLGTGLWQLVVVLLVVFLVGRALSPNPAFAVAAAVPSALVMLLPPPEGGPFERSLDGLVGGVVALLVTALVPRDPRRAALRDGRTLFSVFHESLRSIVDCLTDADPGAGELALGRLRRTQPLIDAWSATLDTALSVARISPWVRPYLPELRRHERVSARGRPDLAPPASHCAAQRVSRAGWRGSTGARRRDRSGGNGGAVDRRRTRRPAGGRRRAIAAERPRSAARPRRRDSPRRGWRSRRCCFCCAR